MKKILFVYGTRPEAIKLAPLIKEFENKDYYQVKICVTAQHREMMDQVNTFFDIKPHFDLNIMTPGQDLFTITAAVLVKIKNILDDYNPDIVFVQGDTSTVFSAALAAFYKNIKVAHVEAGLRTENRYSPFPEEMNRRLTSVLANYHFAPTEEAKANLARENIIDNVYVVGNTVIDALLMAQKKINDSDQSELEKYFEFLDFSKKIILVTGHRRENFGEPFEEICQALRQIAANNDAQIVYPVHLNPNVREPVLRLLSGLKNVFLIEPLDYPRLVWLLEKCYLVLTDSGGIQEEAPSMRKPVLVMREVTERAEGVRAGVAILVGAERRRIIENTQRLLDDDALYQSMAKGNNPYGDGNASKKIEQILRGLN
jgi:UDP-N-acetylglucosamine 2-epimerase (non-hydrolysing)